MESPSQETDFLVNNDGHSITNTAVLLKSDANFPRCLRPNTTC